MIEASIQQCELRPFLKWPGGKKWIAQDITDLISERLTGRYYEPFLGGGAVFFKLRPRHATLSDINENLINVYQQVINNVHLIIEKLKNIPVNSETYYKIREEDIACPIERAVRFLYLNRTAFGGIYRLNKAGKFNVPYGGGQRTPAPLWRDDLLKSASNALKDVEFAVSDFEKSIRMAKYGDVIYCDPTYTVSHENNGFIRYNEKNFSWKDQERLARASKRALKRGASVIVSNACHESLIELYRPYKPLTLKRKSLVSRNPAARREVNEYLFVLDP